MSTADTWASRFSRVLADTLNALSPRLADTAVSMIAIDCHPWNGGLHLAILQTCELDGEPQIGDPAEMAAWQMYNCGESMAEWEPAAVLAAEMRQDYDQENDKQATANDYLQACADALSSPSVRATLQRLNLDASFRISVAHPDNGREFCSDPSAS